MIEPFFLYVLVFVLCVFISTSNLIFFTFFKNNITQKHIKKAIILYVFIRRIKNRKIFFLFVIPGMRWTGPLFPTNFL